jgi:hypothetical protein
MVSYLYSKNGLTLGTDRQRFIRSIDSVLPFVKKGNNLPLREIKINNIINN